MIKAECRRELAEIRGKIPNREEKDQKIFARLGKLIASEPGVLCYVSVGSEVSTRALIDLCLAQKKAVFVPRCESGDALRFFQVHTWGDLSPGRYGIPEPGIHCLPIQGIENLCCLVPGLGFTLGGERIGYGKGYYDRFLRENSVKSIGLCYNEQIRDFLPSDQYDRRVQMLVTDQFLQEVRHVQ